MVFSASQVLRPEYCWQGNSKLSSLKHTGRSVKGTHFLKSHIVTHIKVRKIFLYFGSKISLLKNYPKDNHKFQQQRKIHSKIFIAMSLIKTRNKLTFKESPHLVWSCNEILISQ